MIHTSFFNRSTILMAFWIVFAYLSFSCVSAIAQVPANEHVSHVTSHRPVLVALSPPWQILFHDAVFLAWLFGSLVVAWLFSVILSIAMLQTFYPPNAARFACWLAFSFWGLFVTFVLFGHLYPYFLPPWFVTLLLLVLFIAGVIALVTRRRPV